MKGTPEAQKSAILRRRPPAERLRARYCDLFEREIHFEWDRPEYEAWAAGQEV